MAEENKTIEHEVVTSESASDESHTQNDLPEADGIDGASGPEPALEEGMAEWMDLLEEPEHLYAALDRGDILEGTVMEISKEEILVDIRTKAEGVVPQREFRKSKQAGELDDLQVGSTVFVYVLSSEDDDGRAILSIDRARLEKSWRWLEQLHDEGTIIESTVDGYNKGGLLVNLRGVRGFIPASQVVGIGPRSQGDRQEALSQMVGQTIPLKVIEINRSRNRLIASHRQALQEHRDARKEELLDSLQAGQVYTGTVSSICNFGVFVDLGGADGLVHISELSWARVGHPSEVVEAGQEVEVYVLKIDHDRKRIALSMRRTEPEPWSTVADRYQLGQLVEGQVTQLANFGAFVRLEEGIEGLVHISELADGPVNHPRDVVEEGEEVTVRIIRIDPAHRKIGLSLRRALRLEEDESERHEGYKDEEQWE